MNFLPQLASNCDPSDLHPQVPSITGMSHCTQLVPFNLKKGAEG
jgi:hypothetical protein